jgi:hypothetical protein
MGDCHPEGGNLNRSPLKTGAPLGLAIAVDQLALRYFSRFGIKDCNLLPTGMEITPYNGHESFS